MNKAATSVFLIEEHDSGMYDPTYQQWMRGTEREALDLVAGLDAEAVHNVDRLDTDEYALRGSVFTYTIKQFDLTVEVP